MITMTLDFLFNKKILKVRLTMIVKKKVKKNKKEND